MSAVPEEVIKEVKIDLGCGPNKQAGFVGVDSLAFDGKVDIVLDLGKDKWPWEDNSVDEFHSSHFLEHLDAMERVHFWNELHRVLKSGKGGRLIVPYWNAARAFGDPSHKWPPISEWHFLYLNKTWRKANAPHSDSEHVSWGYNCDFDTVTAYALHPELITRAPEYQQFAIQWYREAAQDSITTVTKK